MTIDTDFFKEKLLEEKTKLEQELSGVGRKNPSNPADWEGTEPESNIDQADEEEVGDKIEGYETNTAIVKQLEARLLEVDAALEKIEQGTYGVCEIGGEKIEEERLKANPAARTCKAHMNSSPII